MLEAWISRQVRRAVPIRLSLFDWIDVLIVADPAQIRWLNRHERVQRPIDAAQGFLHRFVDGRLRSDLGFDGEVMPVFRAREDERRAERQQKLGARFDALRGAPGNQRDVIADYVAGRDAVVEIGPAVQEWCGRLFANTFESTLETYEAGRLLSSWPSAPPWKTFKARLTGELARAKAVLSTAADRDLHCIHATSIGMENVARTVRRLQHAAQTEQRALSADEILRAYLAVPPVVLRSCSGEVDAPFLDRPLTQRSLILFLVARAYAASGDLDDAFLSGTWSGCPARRVVPDMLRSVWQAARHDEAEAKRLMSAINSWSRLWHRAVS